MTSTQPMIVKKSVKHTFSAEETAQLHTDFRQAYASLKAVQADADSVKAQLKAKTTEAESRMETLNSTLQAGFEMRLTDCAVVFRPGDKKKDFFLAEDCDAFGTTAAVVLTEEMTPSDFELDLIQAEAAFEDKAELVLWDVASDRGKLVVGSLAGRWFAAVRGNVGALKFEERLDSEQMATKRRCDAIARAGKRVESWLRANLGKDAARGFTDAIFAVVQAEQDKVE